MTDREVEPYTASGAGLILDRKEDRAQGNRKAFSIPFAAKNWRGREAELELEMKDAKRKGHDFTAFCARQTLNRLKAEL